MRLIDADAYSAEMKKRQDACWHLLQVAKKYGGVSFEGIDRLNAIYAVFSEAKLVLDDMPTIGGWISVKDRLPAETHSIFFPWYGKQKWSSAMWKEQSDKVLVTVAFNDGTRFVTTGETHDGVWHTSISRTLEPDVTHWMPLPEPSKEEA